MTHLLSSVDFRLSPESRFSPCTTPTPRDGRNDFTILGIFTLETLLFIGFFLQLDKRPTLF